MNDDKSKKERSYLPRSWGGLRPRKSGPCSDAESFCPPEESPDDTSRHAPEERQSRAMPPVAEDQSAGCCCDRRKEAAEPPCSERPRKAREEASGLCATPLDAGEAPEALPGPASERTLVCIVGIRFGYACKIYNFDCGDAALSFGDSVVVKTEKGVGLGQVAIAPFKRELDASQMEGLRKITRKATKTDFDQRDRCKQKELEAYRYCIERIEVLDLPMKLIAVESFFDGSKYVFYFTAEGRVDFRELVKQLVARFPVRIEMRQIGVRHEAKMTGGLACCGQELCCSRFLTDFRPVSVKMAKNQNLSLNPTKISGVCGRLMCCLGYEHDVYEEFKKGLPRVGKTVTMTKGEGVILKHNPLAETVSVRFEEETVLEITKDEMIKELESAYKLNKKAGSSGMPMEPPDVDDADSDEYDEQLEKLV
jgi:cell fate regulator YaaT (PSP1 superfamily)